MNDLLRLKIAKLPTCPGCYLMKSEGTIIYVGKAVNLKNRVSQYFHQSRDHTVKVRAMVARIDDFDIVLCDTNLEALILECNLIKLHQPQYNILLKDDKHYPYLRIDVTQDYPRVELVRRVQKDKAKYFGPYMGATGVREVLDVLRGLFPLRTCAQAIRPGMNKRPCLHHQLGECLAPCAGKTTPEEYGKVVSEVVDFLGGKSDAVLSRLQAQMMQAAKEMRFEQAAQLRDRMRDVQALMERQKAINVRGGDQDILACVSDGIDAMVEVVYVRGGRMIGAENYALEGAGDQKTAQVLAQFILQFYDDGRQPAGEVLCLELPEQAEDIESVLTERREGKKVVLHEPQRGTKHKLVELAVKNARDALQKRNAHLERQHERTLGACEALGQVIGMDRTPRRIEGYDISNTQGAQSVGSMVVAIDGEAARSEYRIFRIKTVEGANDFASHYEVMSRRLARATQEREKLIAEGRLNADGTLPEGAEPLSGFADLPDAILIDGGPQQLRFAREAMHAAGYDIPMFALAERLDEIFLPNQEESIYLDRKSPALHLIQRIRDEAHRFGITHHRNLRSKASIRSTLEDIPGIGAARRRALLAKFKSIKSIAGASVEELCTVEGIGPAQAKVIWAHYHKDQADAQGKEE
ncbi:MAG: excinuclease ABC subunit UvrC [Clostridia bacterium]|nr:excinuclease ABC subunit UvrC [Clostridia bacterium]